MMPELDNSDYARQPFGKVCTSSNSPCISLRSVPVQTGQQEVDCAEAESKVIDEKALPLFPRSSIASARSHQKQGSSIACSRQQSLDERSTEAGSERVPCPCLSDTEPLSSNSVMSKVSTASGLRGRRGLSDLSCETDESKPPPQVSESRKVVKTANFKSKSHPPLARSATKKQTRASAAYP